MFHKSKYLVSLIVALVSFGIIAISVLLLPEIEARYLLWQVESLEVGKSTFQDAQGVASRIRAVESTPCDSNECSWAAHVSNSYLPQSWRRKELIFEVGFEVKDSVLVGRGIGAQFGTGNVNLIRSRR